MIIPYRISIILVLSTAFMVFILLFFISAPYGKFLRTGWGPSIRSKWAWMVMEFPSPALMIFLFAVSENKNIPQYLFICFWLSHYLHRTFIYPFVQSGREKAYPVLLVFMAFIFNCLNGFINGYGVFHIYSYDFEYLITLQFVTGSAIFISGFVINKISDSKLRKLRRQNQNEYAMPDGWLFRYISNPHYFGEIIEWGGWAVMTWSLPGFAFFIFTAANLLPRGFATHRWYLNNFPGYPQNRKAVIPFIF